MPGLKEIQSKDNHRLKAARQARVGKDRSRIFIEGARLLREALSSRIRVCEIFAGETFLESPENEELISGLVGRSPEIYRITDKLADSLADTKNTQGVIAIAERPASDKAHFNSALAGRSGTLTVYLHEINNPSNLGAILRTAEAAGVAGVITGANSADAYSAKSLRASMGSAFRLPVWELADIDAAIEWARGRTAKVVAADVKGAYDYSDIDWRVETMLVFGSEAHGLPDRWLSMVDETIKIPLENEVESLNLAVSAGVIVFEALRQRRHSHRAGG